MYVALVGIVQVTHGEGAELSKKIQATLEKEKEFDAQRSKVRQLKEPGEATLRSKYQQEQGEARAKIDAQMQQAETEIRASFAQASE
jgi:hypothetical protein